MTDRIAQYRAVREDVGLLDRSEASKLAITGEDCLTWLQGMVSNDTRLLVDSEYCLQACVLAPTGHVLTDLTLIPVKGYDPIAASLGLAEDFILAELPRANVEKITAVFDRFLIMEDVEIRDVSEALGCFSLQGPEAGWTVSEKLAGKELMADTNHTGSYGIDLYFPTPDAAALRERLLGMGIVEIEPEVQEILRIEAGIPKYGMDMDESVIALEANLGRTHISLTKGCYVGQEIIARIDSRGHTNRALTGLVVEGDTLPIPGDKLFTLPTDDEPGERETGRITSVAAWSPAAGGRPIALGYVRHEHRTPGTRLHARGDNSESELVVAELPIFRKTAA